MLEIIDMWKQETDPVRKEILDKLAYINKDAHKYMKGQHKSWKQKYRALQKTLIWKEGKQLLKQYFFEDNPVRCQMCGRLLTKWTLHHDEDFYSSLNLFTPPYVKIICGACHKEVHSK